MNQKVPVGLWGGEHIALQVNESNASIEFDCARSTIDQQLLTDASGHFDITGVYIRERGGPVRPEQRPDSHPVRYVGWTDGKKMTLTVTLTDTNQTTGTFTLELGREPVIRKCL